MKFQCAANKVHLFDQLPDDYWCPLCTASKSMLVPVEEVDCVSPAEQPIITSIATEDENSKIIESKKYIDAILDFQFPFLLNGVQTEFVLNGVILFEFKAHKSFFKKVSLPQKAEINIRIKSKLLRIIQSSSKFELNLNHEKSHQLTFVLSRWTGKYSLDHKEEERL